MFIQNAVLEFLGPKKLGLKLVKDLIKHFIIDAGFILFDRE